MGGESLLVAHSQTTVIALHRSLSTQTIVAIAMDALGMVITLLISQ
jgi:hypothetical protein